MKEIGIAPITVNNPNISSYINTISFWDNNGSFIDSLNSQNDKILFGVFYDDEFLGASTLILDSNSMEANIKMVIGSLGHKEEIEEFFQQELNDIAINQYGATNVVFDNSSYKEVNKLLVK